MQNLLIFLSAISLLSAGCDVKKPLAPLSLDEAHKRFIQISKEEYNLDVILKPLENTLWIYLPFEKSFYDITVNDGGPKESDSSSEGYSINYLDVNFQKNNFFVKYDISQARRYDRDFGYQSNFTEEYQLAQTNLLTTIARVYIDYAESGEAKEKDNPPEFFIIVIADIAKGLETTTILNFADLKRAMVDPGFQEEYVHRIVRDNVIGKKEIKDDKDGNHLELKEMTWPEFLAKQMAYRVNIQFQYEANKKVDVRHEILTIASQTVEAYQFQDFEAVKVLDLGDQTRQVVDKNELKDYFMEPTRGRIVNIEVNALDPQSNPTEEPTPAP